MRRTVRASAFFEFCVRDRREIVIQPCCDAQNVAVHRRNGQSERDRCHRACRVLADAGQSKQPVVISAGSSPPYSSAQQDRCTVQVAHAAVVAEPLPELGVNGLVRRRESGTIGQRVHPAGKNSRARPRRASAGASSRSPRRGREQAQTATAGRGARRHTSSAAAAARWPCLPRSIFHVIQRSAGVEHGEGCVGNNACPLVVDAPRPCRPTPFCRACAHTQQRSACDRRGRDGSS